MSVTVHVPSSLREFSGGQRRLAIDAAHSATLRDVFTCMRASHPGISERVLDERGAVRQHVNVFVNGQNVRLGNGLQTQVEAGAEIWILPAVSGG
jgi:molybdopterin synthase sulfur carrier subunit